MDEHGTAGKELKTQDSDAVSAGERRRSESSDSMHTSSAALGKWGNAASLRGRLNRQREAAPLSCAQTVRSANKASKPLTIRVHTTNCPSPKYLPRCSRSWLSLHPEPPNKVATTDYSQWGTCCLQPALLCSQKVQLHPCPTMMLTNVHAKQQACLPS